MEAKGNKEVVINVFGMCHVDVLFGYDPVENTSMY